METGSIDASEGKLVTYRRSSGPARCEAPDSGFSMIATMLSLVAVALLALALMSTTLHSGSTSNTSVSNAPGVGEADNLAAQQSLSTALDAVATAASAADGYGSLDVSTLTASDPSVSYVSGSSTSAKTVSFAVTSGSGDGASGSGASAGGAIGAAISGAEAAGAAGTSADTGSSAGGTSGAGTVTLAAHSSSGTCWLVWKGDGSVTWYGAQTGLATCTAPALASAPSPGPVSSSGIDWQQGGFPAA